jgi:replicative DNA helicase
MAEEDAIKRVMPHSIEAEQSVIGAMLMDAEAIEIASEMLKEEDFYARQYGVLFSAILQMHQKGEAVDPVTLQTRLREKNLPPEIYSSSMILDLIDQVPTSANIKSYAGIVSEKSLLRKMIRANEEIAGACYAQKDALEEIMNQAEKKIFEISQRRDSSGFVPIRQIVLNAI